MNFVLPEVQVNYREAHLKFSGRVHHSLRRNLRRKVKRDDALRTFEIVLRSVKRKREKELDSRRNQQQMSVEILLDKKREEGEGEEGRA